MSFASWLRTSSLVSSVYLANLFVSFHYFFVVYINSSFITQFVAEREVGYLYIAGSIVSTILFVLFVRLLRSIGNVRLIVAFIVLEAASLAGLIIAHDPDWIVICFLTHLIISPVIYLNLDIFLEKLIKDERITGSARGLFLTMVNIAQVCSPIIVGLLVMNGQYWKAYLASIGFLFLALTLILVSLGRFKDARYEHPTFRQMRQRLVRSKAFRNVFAAQFLLRFFYAWMVIYTPLYLFRHIGLAWSEIGIVFTIMLIPFLVLELPLGRIADLFIGEKELMTAGFVVLALTVALIPFLLVPSVALWALLLFCTRIGASLVEIASESYFFKHVDGEHAMTISSFRIARPTSFIVAAAVASLTLFILPIQWSFLALAGIMLLGIRHALALKDTK